jgi:hypothetical protein
MVALLLSLSLLSAPQTALRLPGPLSPRIASYKIEASLDPATKTVKGHLRLSWRNPAATAAAELVVHLYMNAFRNEASTFLKESHGRHRRNEFGRHGWGAIDVSTISVRGEDLTARLTVDDTLARLRLDEPVGPGEVVDIDVDFTTRLPKVFARTGWAKDFFAVGQWFPKIAVFDGTWRAHQLHLNSEFFADFGVYDVQIDVPQGFAVGATGIELRREQKKNRTFVSFRAEDVHDFAWFASPRFVERSDAFVDPDGRVALRLLLWPGHEAHAVRHFAAAKAALAELLRRYGPYPYAQITIIDTPDEAEGAGGMEYPTLFTTLSLPVPESVHLHEWVTIHELSHGYFQGIVASDEVEEAWLDEGLTEAMTDWGLSAQFGRERALYDFLGHRLSYTDASRLGYRTLADRDAPATPSWAFLDNGTYSINSYSKIDLILRSAERILGEARFEAGMRRYYQNARFKHPRRADFIRWFNEGTGMDLSSFFQATLETADVLDYQVLSLTAEQIRKTAGLVRSDGGVEIEASPPPDPTAPWRSEVVIHRKGTMALPVDVRVVFEDGSERREHWEDDLTQARWKRYLYETPKAVRAVHLDSLPLDVNRLNDGRLQKSDSSPRRRILFALQRWLSMAFSAVGF